MILLDTSVIIAAARQEDEEHLAAVELAAEIEKSGEAVMLTEVVIGESATFLARRNGPKIAGEYLKRLVSGKNYVIIRPSLEETSLALGNMGKLGLNSYADSLLATLSATRGIKKIASFDSDFDRVKGIKRLH